MTLRVVESDSWVLEQLTTLRTLLNSGIYACGLFSNNITPTPATVWADLVPATFAGFGELSVTSVFAAPVQIRAGEYSILSDVFSWTSTDVTGEQIYGAYVVDNAAGPLLKFCALLPTPVFMVDPVELDIRWDYRGGAMILY